MIKLENISMTDYKCKVKIYIINNIDWYLFTNNAQYKINQNVVE